MRRILLALLLCSTRLAVADDPFSAAIRPTEPLSPPEQQKTFRLPPGFKIRLFASEPDIQKPMNMAFDARGRLWVSGSTEYPHPAPPDRPGRDSIRILEDLDRDGKADTVTVFADRLNIPIGLYPYKQGVIAFSIPNISFYDDRDGDGKADSITPLYGPLGFDRDTHGMNNGFRRGFDGWLYVLHGWANSSTIKGADGSRIDVQGGNCYRVRVDGSRVEPFTWGQVNPFGLTFDARGDLFSADCHTKPIMLLLRRGYYDSFGKPHNGLGYVPPVMEHSHGSTAIAGTTWYSGAHFPADFQGNMFSGNVMTSRVNRDSIRVRGSSIQAVEEPDFVTTTDPWFRPVDLQIGPDGAMYIADFYNKIIGHVEVPLNHPQRDKTRGRIWRVTYEPGDQPARLDPSPNLRSMPARELIDAWRHPNLGIRLRAADEMVDRIGAAGVPLTRDALTHEKDTIRAHALWTLFRLMVLREVDLARAAADQSPLVRLHAARILSETSPWSSSLEKTLIQGVRDSDAMVRRAAVDAIGQHPRPEHVDLLLDLDERTNASDVHLKHSIRMALLESLRTPGTLNRWVATKPSKPRRAIISDIALALPDAEAGAYLLEELRQGAKPTNLEAVLSHVAKNLSSPNQVDALVELVHRDVKDLDKQLDLLLSIKNGLAQRGGALPNSLKQWARELSRRLFESVDWSTFDWGPTKDSQDPRRWRLEPRRSQDNEKPVPFLSSLPLGEGYVGTIRSAPFVIPPRLTFCLCGHLGPPQEPEQRKNFVRLRRERDGAELKIAYPPRDDVARLVDWDLRSNAGETASIEVVDGLATNGYAWLALARFVPPVVKLPSVSPDIAVQRLKSAGELADAMGLVESVEPLRAVVDKASIDLDARCAAARALANLSPNPTMRSLAYLFADPALEPYVRETIAREFSRPKRSTDELLTSVMKVLPHRLVVLLSERLVEHKDGVARIIDLASNQVISARVLLEPLVRDKIAADPSEATKERFRLLTSGLPTYSAEMQQLIDARRASFARATNNPARGREIFAKHCQVCHSIKGEGKTVGPQLDGIGQRGVERIIEDILDPDRNVDPAFHASVYVLQDGRVLTGLFRRQEGKSVVIVDAAGKEMSFSTDDIDSQRKTRHSPMPHNVGAALTETEFLDLASYLSQQRGEPEKGSAAASQTTAKP